MNRLFSIYGELLSHSQKEILSDYYENNLSITEIADEKNISRSAVEDALKKGSNKLLHYEKELGICSKSDEIVKILEKIKNKIKDEEVLKDIEEIGRKL